MLVANSGKTTKIGRVLGFAGNGEALAILPR
jgi:hypothetical protein